MQFLKNFFRKLKYTRNKNNPDFWTPFDMSLLEQLQVGDFLMVELMEDMVDIVALSMGIGSVTDKGSKKLWRVKKRDHGALMLCGGERSLLQYWGWQEGNICKVTPSPFVSAPFQMKVFYHNKEKRNDS